MSGPLLADRHEHREPRLGPDYRPIAEFPVTDRAWWTERTRSARSRDLLQPRESPYDATGRQIAIAFIPHPGD